MMFFLKKMGVTLFICPFRNEGNRNSFKYMSPHLSPQNEKASDLQRLYSVQSGLDGTRTRDPVRDRHVF